MPISRKDTAIPSSGALPHDDDAPISEPRPSSPEPGVGLFDDAGPSSYDDLPLPPDSGSFPVDGAPPGDEDAAIAVTRELTNAFLAKKATLDRVRQVVGARATWGTQQADLENMVQTALVHALSTMSLARSVAGMRPWVSRIAQNVVIDEAKANKQHLKWLDRSVDVQEVPPDAVNQGEDAEVPPEDPTAPPRPVESLEEPRLDRYLGSHVKTAGDRQILEMIRQKARTGQTNAQVAAEFGVTEDAFDARLRRFRDKWVPQWKKSEARRQRMRMLVWLGGALLIVGAAVLAWWLLHARKTEDARGTVVVPVVFPAPSASVVPPEDGRFNQSAPTEEEPARPKP